LAIAVGILVASYGSAQAAIELLFFTAESTNTSVLLSWATAREINVQGYKILCKRQDEPESAYHVIGTRIAQGGPDQAASYSFDVTSGVYYGEQYCFRLEEETTDGLPGEKLDICGFGPGVTPTPAVGEGVFGADLTLTPIVVTPIPGFSPAPTLITPTIPGFPGDTPTPIGQSPLEAPTQPFSPLETPDVTATILAAAAFAATPTWTPMQPASPLGSVPVDAASVALDMTATALAAPTQTPTETPTETPTFTPTPSATLASPTETATVLAQGAPPAGDGGMTADGAPTPMYIVVTATPTEEAVAIAPSMTPLPTTTPTPDMGLLSVLTPSAQNMMIMLLCLIFLSATGLGTLGLVTAILYFRSQAQRSVGADEFTPRRRF
jgi:hypothetical protein